LQPVVTGIAPATGDVAGGTVVTITGTNLVHAVVGSVVGDRVNHDARTQADLGQLTR